MMTSFRMVLKTGLVITSLLVALPLQAQQAGQTPPPPKVTVVTLQAEDVTLTSTLPGRVIASAEAEVRPQVNGIVTERLFEEGRTVKEGQPLYHIDPRSYQAAVAQAEAALSQARAQAEASRREANRVGELRDRRVASEQSQDAAVAARDAADAAVEAAQAALDGAKIDLDRATVTAPIDGVIGLAQVSEGQLVTASQASPLAVIRRIDPVYVDVTQSSAEITRWQRQGGAASMPDVADQNVHLQLADGSVYEETGSLRAAEPHVDETTGVVTLRMEFANPQRLLLPGMYVLAEIPQAKLKDAILAPQEGVTRDRRGRPVAYVVGSDNVVQERQVDILQDRGNKWVVREGLAPGDRLIVEGFQFIQAGAPVTPEERTAPDAAAPGGAPAQAEAANSAAEAAGSAAKAADAAAEAAKTGAEPAADQGADAAGAEAKSGDAADAAKTPDSAAAPAASDAGNDAAGADAQPAEDKPAEEKPADQPASN